MNSPLQQGKKPKILLVDDNSDNINLLSELLKPYYRRVFALFGARAIEIATSQDPPDLILLDVMMPGIDGFEVCRRIKEDETAKRIPIIFVTAMGAIKDELKGFEAGGVDYITKPITPHTVLARVATHLELYDKRIRLAKQNEILEEKVKKRTQELKSLKDTALLTLANLAETRDNETGGHIRRTQVYIRILANQLLDHPRFKKYFEKNPVSLLFEAAPLHDVGKVGVPDKILLKPGLLSEDEFQEMKKHTKYGRDALKMAKVSCGCAMGEQVFSTAMEIAYSHHEKWRGGGYPDGLKGEEIPIPARLMALADIYDALVSRRCYKTPMSHQQAVKIITHGDEITSPKDFDPDVLEAFVEVKKQFREVAVTLADSNWERDTI